MMVGAYRIRLGIGRTWLSVLSCAIALAAFIGLAVAFGYLSYQTAAFANTLRNPRATPKLPPDWASEWPPENRSKYNKMLAEMTFETQGESAQYFELRGEVIDLLPTAEDKLRRGAYLTSIQTTERQPRVLPLEPSSF